MISDAFATALLYIRGFQRDLFMYPLISQVDSLNRTAIYIIMIDLPTLSALGFGNRHLQPGALLESLSA